MDGLEIGITPTQMSEIRFKSSAARLLFIFIIIIFLMFKQHNRQKKMQLQLLAIRITTL